MNTEYILGNIKTILETYIDTEIDTIEIESNSSTLLDNIAEFKLGEFIDPNILTLFPSICIYSPGSDSKNDYQNFQEREVTINILTWIVENDLENLHRFISRCSDAIQRVLRTESYYNNNDIYNPIIKKAENTDLYKRDVGYAQGLLVTMTVNYLMS
jgi:hypothetical protein